MGSITGLTAARMLAIEGACIVDGEVVGEDLILTKHDASTINAGSVKFPVPVVTALPGSPADGDEVYLQTAAMYTAKVMWHLRYDSTPNKWEFLGGANMRAEATGGQTSTSGAPAAWSNGPLLTVPVTGEYEVDFGFSGMVDSSTTYEAVARATLYRDTTSLSVHAGAKSAVGAPNDGALYTDPFKRAPILSLTAGWVLKLYISLQRPGGAVGTARFAQPGYITIKPIRL